MDYALKVLTVLFWILVMGFSITILMQSTFPKLKLKYIDYVSLLAIFSGLVFIAKMVWSISL
jgi:hypothetical protein